jgi:hypothetical protein
MTVSETKRREQRVNSSQVVIPCSSCQAKVGEPCSRPGQNGSCLARVSQVFREIDRTVEYPTCRSQPGDSCAVPGQGHPLRYGVAYAARDRSKDIPHLLTPGGYQVHEYHLLLDEIRSSDRMRVVSFDVRCGGKSYSVDRFAASYDGGPWFIALEETSDQGNPGVQADGSRITRRDLRTVNLRSDLRGAVLASVQAEHAPLQADPACGRPNLTRLLRMTPRSQVL